MPEHRRESPIAEHQVIHGIRSLPSFLIETPLEAKPRRVKPSKKKHDIKERRKERREKEQQNKRQTTRPTR